MRQGTSGVIRPIKLIVIHCSATRENCSYPPEQLEVDHRARGFHRAGYHYYILRSGECVKMRPLAMVPAHAKGYNRHSVAVCYEGGLDAAEGLPKDTRTEAQRETMRLLIEQLAERFPEARICGHRDLSPDLNNDGVISSHEWMKECPCFNVEEEFPVLLA